MKFKKDDRVVIVKQPVWANEFEEKLAQDQKLKPDIGRKGVIVDPEISSGFVSFLEDGAPAMLCIEEACFEKEPD